jgi:tRNA pseudouridine38-40 synthase
MRSLKLTVAYFGKKYVGWQVQLNGLSVQEVLELAWTKVTQESVRITASGRTDSGVHALAQICSVATDSNLEPEVLRRALNAHTPFDIEVTLIEEAREGFHAIRHAVQKTYRYQINWGQPRDVFQDGRSWYIPKRLDVGAMQKAAKFLVGQHDFSSFMAKNSSVKTTVRTILELTVDSCQTGLHRNLVLEITADGFLYNMVRNIVGTLVEVGYGTRTVDWVSGVLLGCDRELAGMTAPAWGLYLVKVEYGADHLAK